jgi:hypothetical protein
MKCVKLNQIIKRLENTEADSLVLKGWKYCSKTEWRKSLTPSPTMTSKPAPQEIINENKELVPRKNEVEKILKQKVRKHKKSTEGN